MIGLDSLYAMLARPVQASIKRKRIVEETENGSGIAEDSHEAPQSQLPPDLERRHTIEDRRGASRGDRRRQTKQATEKRKANKGKFETLLPHIDIDV
ncbi:hypothetical protein HWQ46_14500 [Shewanella sp. D64]|nr:hypothetical protein [Shewanella sp. MTB7]MEC4726761.1 hypothetical protein [Shewanella sp. D64]MEC4739127.1 hypothetical protein [Shewanella sp. E94]WBJ98063.1 hypothetical protein HWQ47_02255 [Shewanella sp. MTB7]